MFKLRKYQSEAINSVLTNIKQGNRLLCLVMWTGTWKALENNEPVLTQDWYIPIWDIQVWDIVYWKQWEEIPVIWVYPQGIRDTYKVTFSDHTYILADWEHIWSVMSNSDRCRNKKFLNKTTLELKSNLTTLSWRTKWFLPIVEPIQFVKKELEIHPYLLWALLWDWSFRSVMYKFSSSDETIICRVNDYLRDLWLYLQFTKWVDYEIKQKDRFSHWSLLKKFCKKYNLKNKYSYEKHIPSHYLYSNIEDRKELLAWLLDTDWTVDKRGRATFTTTSKQLSKDIIFLLQSLGSVPIVSTRIPNYSYKGEKKKWRLAYTISINTNFIPFKLQRHIDRYNDLIRLVPSKSIKSIEYLWKKKCTCIKVDSEDELFVANNFTLTHNTFTFSHIAKEAIKSWKKVLVIAHREELLTQAKNSLELIVPEAKVMIEQWTLIADNDCDIIVASVPTLWREWSNRLQKLDKSKFWLIIIDELHHWTSDTYVRILDYFWAYKSWDRWLIPWHPVVLWVTATPTRSDNVWLDKIVDTIAYKYDMRDAINDWYLTPLRAYTVFTDTDIDSVKTTMWDFAIWELSDTVNNVERNLQIVETYKSKCDWELIVIFAVDVNHAKTLSWVFNSNWIKAWYITWALKKEERQRVLQSFYNWEIKVLVNISVLTEGWDFTAITWVFLARPTKSSWLYIQMIWRWVRLHPWKEYCKIFDFVDNARKNRIVTASSLIWLSQPIKADNTDIFEAKDKLEELLSHKPYTNLRELDLDKIDEKIAEIDIFAISELDEFVKANSKYAWTVFLEWFKISLGEDDNWDRLSVEIRENTLWKYNINFIKAVKQEPTFQNWFKKFYNKVIANFDVNKKEEALQLADKVISDNHSERVWLVDTSAVWREKKASDKQVEILKKNGYPNADRLTSGQASQLITKVFSDKFNSKNNKKKK